METLKFSNLAAVTGVILTFMLTLGAPVWAKDPSEKLGQLIISEVVIDYEDSPNIMTISGQNFDNGVDPIIELCGNSFTPDDFGDSYIEVDLTTVLSSMLGKDCLLTVKTGEKINNFDAYSLTIGTIVPKPAHEWNGTALRFENPDGTWGAYEELKGEKGDPGPQGEPGNSGVDGVYVYSIAITIDAGSDAIKNQSCPAGYVAVSSGIANYDQNNWLFVLYDGPSNSGHWIFHLRNTGPYDIDIVAGIVCVRTDNYQYVDETGG